MNRCRLAFLFSLTLLNSFFASAMAQVAPEGDPPAVVAPDVAPFPDLTVPEGDLKTLDAFVAKAKAITPRNPQQHQAMQTAIRDGSKKILELLKGKEDSARYLQAEFDSLSAGILLLTFAGEDSMQKTVEQVHVFLKGRNRLSLSDVQIGWFAANMLELQPNKKPAMDTYKILDELLAEDEREDMQSMRVNVAAAIRRLDLLGKKLDLVAETRDGKVITTADLKGKFVLVNFFDSSIKTCLAEIPRLKMHYQKYHTKGLEVLGISTDGSVTDLESFLGRANLEWPIVHDNKEDPLDRLAMQFGISTLPTVFLLNKEGVLVSLEARGSELDRLMQMLFETPTPAAPIANGQTDSEQEPTSAPSVPKD